MKVPRTRAWRRRKSRIIVSKIRETKEWLISQFQNSEVKTKAKEERKRHRPGKLTHRQDLRHLWANREEMVDGI